MTQIKAQPSFNSGEWAPSLYSRVDLEKYRSAAALIRNFFVDYRGGVSTRPGTRYVATTISPVTRLIPFQASNTVGYVLEFGHYYIRPFYNGLPVISDTYLNITSIAIGTTTTINFTGTYSFDIGDSVYLADIVGTTELNDHYATVVSRTSSSITIAVNSTAFGAYVSAGVS